MFLVLSSPVEDVEENLNFYKLIPLSKSMIFFHILHTHSGRKTAMGEKFQRNRKGEEIDGHNIRIRERDRLTSFLSSPTH